MPTLPLRRGDAKPLLLELDLSQPLLDVEPDDPLSKLRSRGRPRLRTLVKALHGAADDPRVGALVAKIGNAAIPLAQVQDLRDAVTAFARSGKPTVAWAESFGESSPASVSYYLASAFGEIWLQPSGELNLIGLSAEVQFLRGALDKLGIDPQIEQRYEYKNAADRVRRTELSEAHRESLDRLTASAWEQIVEAVAQARGKTADDVQALADRAPLFA